MATTAIFLRCGSAGPFGRRTRPGPSSPRSDAPGGIDQARRVRGHRAVRVARGGRRSFAENPLSPSEGGFRRKDAWQAGRGERWGRSGLVASQGSERQTKGGSTSRPRAGLRLHPGVRHGAVRRRRCEWEQPHYVSWRPAWAGDAEWMFGESRTRLAPGLDKGFLMDAGPKQARTPPKSTPRSPATLAHLSPSE